MKKRVVSKKPNMGRILRGVVLAGAVAGGSIVLNSPADAHDNRRHYNRHDAGLSLFVGITRGIIQAENRGIYNPHGWNRHGYKNFGTPYRPQWRKWHGRSQSWNERNNNYGHNWHSSQNSWYQNNQGWQNPNLRRHRRLHRRGIPHIHSIHRGNSWYRRIQH
jgi:hypothetical protein